jgi:hypothetical protein
MIAQENKIAVGKEGPGSATKIDKSYEHEKLYSAFQKSLDLMNHKFNPQESITF